MKVAKDGRLSAAGVALVEDINHFPLDRDEQQR